MSRRTSQISSGSLDLFLDTICNTFGGIMFLAILLTMMVQMRGKSEAPSAEASPDLSPPQIMELMSELARLDRQYQELQQAIVSLEKKVATPEQAGISDLQQQLDEARAELDRQMREQNELIQKLGQRKAENAQMSVECDEIENRLNEARSLAADKTTQLEESIASREQKVQVPKVRETSKENWILLLRYGKLYLVEHPSGVGVFSEHVQLDPSNGEIAPRPEAGWDFQASTDLLQFEAQLKQHPSSQVCISIGVWPDSYEAFNHWKKVFVEANYEYQLVPLENMATIGVTQSQTRAKVQ